MSRIRKDSSQVTNTVLELVRRDDGKFDLFLNGKLDRSRIQGKWLPHEPCVRFGLCAEECDSILRGVSQDGRKTVVFRRGVRENGLFEIAMPP